MVVRSLRFESPRTPRVKARFAIPHPFSWPSTNSLTLKNPTFVLPACRVPKYSPLLAGLVLLIAAFWPAIGGPIAPGQASASKLVAPAKLCPNLTAKGGKAAMKRARRSMVCMMNFARKKKRLSRFRHHGKLDWSAGRKAKDILRCEFSHSACGRDFAYWIKKSGYSGRSIGENIAWGSGSAGTVRKIFVAWMKSPPHRRAILNPGYRDVGPGVVKGQFQGYAGARVWVLHFGEK